MMKNNDRTKRDGLVPIVSRRRFVQGITAGAVAAMHWTSRPAFGETSPNTPSILTGNRFELTVDSRAVNFTGRHAGAHSINGCVPGPTLKWKEGDTVTISVVNRLKKATSIHWHGVRLPAEMDGVPGLSFAGIPAGETLRLPHTSSSERNILVPQP